MTKTEIKAEVQYRLAKAIFTTLANEELISVAELDALKKACAGKLKPMIGELEVNSIAGETNYQGQFYPEA